MYIFNQDFIIYRPRGKCIVESDERRQLVGGARLGKGVWREKITHWVKTVDGREGRLHPQCGRPAISQRNVSKHYFQQKIQTIANGLPYCGVGSCRARVLVVSIKFKSWRPNCPHTCLIPWTSCKRFLLLSPWALCPLCLFFFKMLTTSCIH